MMVTNTMSNTSRSIRNTSKVDRHTLSNHFALAEWNTIRGIFNKESFPNGLAVAAFDG